MKPPVSPAHGGIVFLRPGQGPRLYWLPQPRQMNWDGRTHWWGWWCDWGWWCGGMILGRRLHVGCQEKQGVGGEGGVVGQDASADHLVYLSPAEPLAAQILLLEFELRRSWRQAGGQEHV